MNSDFRDLLSLFELHGVRYFVAGGYAVMFHSEPRYTKDIDVVVGSGPGEVERVAAALAEFGFPMSPSQINQLRQPNQMIVLGRPPSRIDILNEISGVDFEEAWPRRVEVKLGEQSVSFISLEDLITAKRAAGRPQDLTDLKKLLGKARAGAPATSPDRKRRTKPE